MEARARRTASSRRFVVVTLVTLVTVGRAQAESVRFPSDNSDLQVLIDGLSPGDTVLVEPGQWSVNRVYLRDGITVRAENGNAASTTLAGASNVTTLYATDVSGVVIEDLSLKWGWRAISCGGSQVLLRGVGIRDSREAVICVRSSQVVMEDVIISGNDDYAIKCGESDLRVDGAVFSGNTRAVECRTSQVSFDRAIFRDNGRTGNGAGLWCYSTDVVLTDCVFESNAVGYEGYTQTTWWYSGEGGGVFLTNGSTMTARDVTFDSNHTWYAGAGLGLDGEGTSAFLEDCKFRRNTTSTHVGSDGSRQCGAGMSVMDGAEAVLVDVWFSDNWSNVEGGAICVGGYPSGARAELTRCIFVGNEAEFDGHAMFVESGMADLTNCTVSEEVTGAAVSFGYGSTGTMSNCVFWPGYVDCSGGLAHDVDIRKCCGAQPGVLCTQQGYMPEDPRFCSTRARDFSLCGDSPCVPMNNEWNELIGAAGVGCGPCNTAVLDATWGSIKAMFRGD